MASLARDSTQMAAPGGSVCSHARSTLHLACPSLYDRDGTVDRLATGDILVSVLVKFLNSSFADKREEPVSLDINYGEWRSIFGQPPPSASPLVVETPPTLLSTLS